MADRLAAVPAFTVAASEVADLGKGEEQVGLRRLDGLGVQANDDFVGVALVMVFEVKNAQRLPGPRREVTAGTDAGFPRFEQVRRAGAADTDSRATGAGRAKYGDAEGKADESG